MAQQTVVTDNVVDTERIAAAVGAHLRGGEVIELVSDLGGGKTSFTRGLAHGADSKDRVASPTFTVSKVYSAPTFAIHHFDFYRLADAGLAAHELQDIIHDPEVVIVVEWSDVVAHVLPDDRLKIHIATTGDESRTLTLTYPDSLHYLVESL
jgi:tRNA threonylcarbamoyladenosine biosynthesis protein TsaE